MQFSSSSVLSFSSAQRSNGQPWRRGNGTSICQLNSNLFVIFRLRISSCQAVYASGIVRYLFTDSSTLLKELLNAAASQSRSNALQRDKKSSTRLFTSVSPRKIKSFTNGGMEEWRNGIPYAVISLLLPTSYNKFAPFLPRNPSRPISELLAAITKAGRATINNALEKLFPQFQLLACVDL